MSTQKFFRNFGISYAFTGQAKISSERKKLPLIPPHFSLKGINGVEIKKKGLQKTLCNPLILMVGQDRIELSTHGFSVRCSTD